MGKLTETSAFADVDLGSFGDVTLAEVALGPVHAVMPYRGQAQAMQRALQAAHGLDWPAPGQVSLSGNARCVWTGLDQAFLIGVTPADTLALHGSIVDQSDAWACLSVSGPDHVAVLSRLVPLDLRSAQFPVGRTARSLLQHMNVILTRTSDDEIEVMAFRAMAGTLAHDLSSAAKQVAARRKLGSTAS